MSKTSQKSSRKGSRKCDAKKLRDQQMLAEIASGKTVQEVANKFNLSRSAATKILNSQEVKDIVEQGESKMLSLVEKCFNVIELALESGREDLTNAVNTATKVLKSVGIMKDKLDVAHTFPKPTVIKRRSGEEVVLGTEEEE